ncbi:MAG: tRNA dihydrouridine synthase DusB [Desulfobulbaceae bacterium]|nr:tRNA dihydrouridine synthase DusB [Desulfobulbaceae bacterium]
MKNKPFKIGSLTLENPFILAPLAGYTDLPFRLLCREFGADLVFSEMISCHGLAYNQQKTIDMIRSCEEERPVAIQLFGAEPELMGEAAHILSREPIDIIDINMGCPVKKVTKKGAGSALMKTPELAREIITQVCENTNKPVTVKFRSGWNHQAINAPEFARMAQEAGAKAVTVHARTWSDGFSGCVDWSVIEEVKKNVTIPVIGNGDIMSYQQGLKMMEQTGCDGVMIGRAALGAPWIFRVDAPLPTPLLRLTALKRHLELIETFCNPQWALGKTRNHAGRYFKGMKHGSAIRNRIYQVATFTELQNTIDSLLSEAGSLRN